MRHSEFREWAEAALGDPRQVYARKADAPSDAPLVFMPDGQAEVFRDRAQAGALICPVPGCPSPKLSTRGGERRDHFFHVKAPADPLHSQQYARLATRRLLLDWAIGQTSVTEIVDKRVEGVAITLIAHLDDGSRVALCYVDMKLGADAWEDLNYDLKSEGLAASWIFALRKMYFAPPDPAAPVIEDPGRTDLILDQPIYRRMRWKGSWPLIINLDRQELGNVVKPGGGPAKRLRLLPPNSNRVQHFVAYPLSRCQLCRDGVATPGIPARTLYLSRNNWKT
jgi:hypothetical protein